MFCESFFITLKATISQWWI